MVIVFSFGVALGFLSSFLINKLKGEPLITTHVNTVNSMEELKNTQRMCREKDQRLQLMAEKLSLAEQRCKEVQALHDKVKSELSKQKHANVSGSDALRSLQDSLTTVTNQQTTLRSINATLKRENSQLAHQLRDEQRKRNHADDTWRESILLVRKDLEKQAKRYSQVVHSLTVSLRLVSAKLMKVTEYLASLKRHGFEAPTRMHSLRGTVRWHILQALAKSPLVWDTKDDEAINHSVDEISPLLHVRS